MGRPRDTLDEMQDDMDRRAAWQLDVDECADCQEADGEDVCPAHDLDDRDVARRYGLGR